MATNNPTSTTSTPLSKAAIYQTLSESEPNRQKNHHRSLANNEAGLMNFLHDVNVRYNTTTTTPPPPPPTQQEAEEQQRPQRQRRRKADSYRLPSGRMMSPTEYGSRLEGRTLTLVGGGFNKNVAAAASLELLVNNKKNQQQQQQRINDKTKQTPRSHHQKKKRGGGSNRWNRDQRKRQKLIHEDRTQNTQQRGSGGGGGGVQHQLEFIKRANQLWNEYASGMLLCSNASCNNNNDEQLSIINREVTAHTMDWVGAKVRIESCASYPAFVGRLAHVMATTRNTWCCVDTITTTMTTTAGTPPPKQQSDDNDKVGQLHPKKQQQEANSEHEGNPPATTSDSNVKLRQFFVPKQNSTLSVLLPHPNDADLHISLLIDLEST